MAHFNFVIPGKREELLSANDDYYVKNVVVQREIPAQLKNAKTCLREEGAEFILDNFDIYYSVLHFCDVLPLELVHRAYQDLHKAAIELNKSLGFLLEDKSSLNEELKQKYQNIMKMLVYIYTQTVLFVENKNVLAIKNQGLMKARKKSVQDEVVFKLDKRNILLTLNNIIQNDIALFWDPPVVEENFLNIVSEVCYKFLENATVKGEKEVRQEIFNLIGTLIKTYNHGTTFAIRMVQMIKSEEHLVVCLSEGVQQLVQTFNCKGLVHGLVREITEWQTDEKFQDSQGSRFCAQLLTAMAVLMPDLMIPELLYLNKYLNHESATLRNSILNVIAEVIINVLSKPNSTDEEIESRNDFLSILMEHMEDVSAHVRSRVLQHFARLQKENAIPRSLMNEILEDAIDHLDDKAALVRKSAANCVTAFLVYNPYSAQLSHKYMQVELENKESDLNSVRSKVDQLQLTKMIEIEAKWESIAADLTKVIEEELNKVQDSNAESEDEDDETSEENETDTKQIGKKIRLCLNEGKYREAYLLYKKSSSDIEELNDIRVNNEPRALDVYLIALKTIYINPVEIIEQMRQAVSGGGFDMTEEDLQKYEKLLEDVEFLKEQVAFLQLLDDAIAPMTELLETSNISDMQEAIEFFTAAFKFNLDNAEKGIMAMLRIMQRNEQDRKDMITSAFKTIYLITDSNNLAEHCTTVVNRLINFLKNVPSVNLDDFELIISEWVAKGTLDNSVIDMLWQYFTKKIAVSDEDCHASLELLRMAAISRKTIITRNLKLVTTVAISEMGANNLAFLGSACEFLAVSGRDRIEITSKDAPFKIKPEDPIFKDLFDILLKKFFEPVEFYYKALSGAISFVYKLCSKPELPCENFIQEIIDRISKDVPDTQENFELDTFITIRLCQLLGLVALHQLDYLDETVYKELKRREYIRNDKKNGGTNTAKKGRKKVSKSATENHSALMNSSLNLGNAPSTAAEESTLEGAVAEDDDAEFILRVLEHNTVTGSGGLGKLAFIITDICEKPHFYTNPLIQGSAVTALIRYMLVSTEFCAQYIQLLFTIFEKTEYSEVKVSILVHLSDLLGRFPNIIEPWTPRIAEKLKDPSDDIKKATYFTLSSLILRDMIRANSYISQMVNGLIEEDKELVAMARTFFITLAHKENNLYNVLPDIFSHLMDSKEVSEENIKHIMKFLFELMDKTKHMENLVDRFCTKFLLSEDLKHHQHIAYCLSLIQYNEKALKKLQDHFPSYKHLVHDPEVYGSFKTILQTCSKHQTGKADLKAIVAEIEKTINAVFELNEDGRLMRPPPPPKSVKKAQTQRRGGGGAAGRRRPLKSQNNSDSDDDEELFSKSSAETPVRQSARKRKERRKIVDSCDSD